MSDKKLDTKIDSVLEELETLYTDDAVNSFTADDGTYQIARGTKGTKGSTIVDEAIDTSNVDFFEPQEPLIVSGKGSDEARIVDILAEGKMDKPYVLGSDGTPIFKRWDQADVEQLQGLMKDLNMGVLDQYKGPMKKLLKDAELDFDAGQFSDAVGLMFAKRIDQVVGKTSMEELKQAAKKLSQAEFYHELVNRKAGTTLSRPAYMRALIETQVMTYAIRNEAKRIKRDGGTPESRENFMKMWQYLQLLVTEGAASTRVSAQNMATLKNQGRGEFTQEDWLAGMESIQKIIDADIVDQSGNVVGQTTVEISMDTLDEVVNSVDKLTTHQIQYAARISRSKGPNWWDAMAEIYTNALLFHPFTLAINMLGNGTLLLSNAVELGIASGLNKIPGFKAVDGTTIEEVIDVMTAIGHGTKRGFREAVEGAKSGRHISNYGGKMDFRYEGNAFQGSTFLGDGFRETDIGRGLSNGLDYIGTFINLPKNSMIFQDEFTKGIVFDMELASLARKAYNQELNKTGDKALAEDALYKVITDPSDEHKALIEKKMAERTFQADLPDSYFGVFKLLGSLAQVPVVKFYMPFYKTLVNIMIETNKRNPVTAFLMPSVHRDLWGGDRLARQMATSRLVLGTGVMTMIGMYVYDPDGTEQRGFVITGAPPADPDDRRVFLEKGLLPYSMAILGDDNQYTSISYAKIEPLGRIMGITADYRQIASQLDAGDESRGEEMAMALLEANYNYFGTQPFIESSAEISDLFSIADYSTGKLGPSIYDKFVNKALEVGGQMIKPMGRSGKFLPNVGEVSSLLTGDFDDAYTEYMARMHQNFIKLDYDITSEQFYEENTFAKFLSLGKYDSMAEMEQMGDASSSTYKAYKILNKHAYELVYFNPEVGPKLSEFGKEQRRSEAYSPAALSKENSNVVYNYWRNSGLLLSDVTEYMGIKLTSDEKRDFITFLNEDRDGDGTSDYFNEIRNVISTDEFLNLGQAYDTQGNAIGRQLQRREMLAVRTKYAEAAKQKMLDNDPRLAQRYYATNPDTVGIQR